MTLRWDDIDRTPPKGARFESTHVPVARCAGRNVAGALAEFGFPVSSVALCQRVVYAESAAQGLAVIEAEPNSEAAREVALLGQTILDGKMERQAA